MILFYCVGCFPTRFQAGSNFNLVEITLTSFYFFTPNSEKVPEENSQKIHKKFTDKTCTRVYNCEYIVGFYQHAIISDFHPALSSQLSQHIAIKIFSVF